MIVPLLGLSSLALGVLLLGGRGVFGRSATGVLGLAVLLFALPFFRGLLPASTYISATSPSLATGVATGLLL